MFFGRLVCLSLGNNFRAPDSSPKLEEGSARQLIAKFDVKKRAYYGNTSMESEISLLMANQTLVCVDPLTYIILFHPSIRPLQENLSTILSWEQAACHMSVIATSAILSRHRLSSCLAHFTLRCIYRRLRYRRAANAGKRHVLNFQVAIIQV